jgi:hypothetical protein
MTEAKGLLKVARVKQPDAESRRSSAALTALLLFLVGCGSAPAPARLETKSAPPASPAPAPEYTQAKPINRTWASEFQFATKSLKQDGGARYNYEISVECPQIINARGRAARKFNSWLWSKILGDAVRFRSLARADSRHSKRGKYPPPTEGLEISYIIYYSDSRLISLRLTHRVMEPGQMHPINYYETINYDLRAGRELQPRDLFKSGYLVPLAAYCRTELVRQFGDSYKDPLLVEGTKPKAENFADWNIVPDGILISFEDYQVGPHSMGQPELVVPYSALSGSLKTRVHGQRRCLAKLNEICPY